MTTDVVQQCTDQVAALQRFNVGMRGRYHFAEFLMRSEPLFPCAHLPERKIHSPCVNGSHAKTTGDVNKDHTMQKLGQSVGPCIQFFRPESRNGEKDEIFPNLVSYISCPKSRDQLSDNRKKLKESTNVAAIALVKAAEALEEQRKSKAITHDQHLKKCSEIQDVADALANHESLQEYKPILQELGIHEASDTKLDANEHMAISDDLRFQLEEHEKAPRHRQRQTNNERMVRWLAAHWIADLQSAQAAQTRMLAGQAQMPSRQSQMRQEPVPIRRTELVYLTPRMLREFRSEDDFSFSDIARLGRLLARRVLRAVSSFPSCIRSAGSRRHVANHANRSTTQRLGSTTNHPSHPQHLIQRH